MGGSITRFGHWKSTTMCVDFAHLERILDFYIAVLGYRISSREDHQVHLVRPDGHPQIGDQLLLVPEERFSIKVIGASSKKRPAYIRVADVEDIDNAVAACKRMGLRFLSPWNPGDKSVQIESPLCGFYELRERPRG